MSETLFTFLGVAQWFCLAHHSPFLPKPRVCLCPCPIGGLVAFCCGAGLVTEVSYFALRSIVVECFPSLPQKTIAPLTPTISLCCSSRSTMTAVAASKFAPSLLSVTGSQGPGGEQHISHPGIPVLQHPDPPALDIHLTTSDDPLSRETSQPTASPFLSIRTVLRASHVGTELQPEKLEQGRVPNVRE